MRECPLQDTVAADRTLGKNLEQFRSVASLPDTLCDNTPEVSTKMRGKSGQTSCPRQTYSLTIPLYLRSINHYD